MGLKLKNQSSSDESPSLSNTAGPKAAVLAKIGKTHGIKGWVRVISFTSPADNILDYQVFEASRAGNTITLEIQEYKSQVGGFIALIKGYETPEMARQLTGLELTVALSELPELDQDDVYWYQLEGLEVQNQHKQSLGTVLKLLETGANDVLVITPNEASIDDRERLIPFIRGTIINNIDLAGGLLSVNWEADYLE
jgi:16S rRNA processing protein RimM